MFTGMLKQKGRRFFLLLTLAAGSILLGAGAVSADTDSAPADPIAKDPFDNSSTILRDDSVIVIGKHDESSGEFFGYINPGGKNELEKDSRSEMTRMTSRRSNGGKYAVYGTTLNEEGEPFVIISDGGRTNSIKIYKVAATGKQGDKITGIELGDSGDPKEYKLPWGNSSNYVPYGFAVGRWDKSRDDESIFVIANDTGNRGIAIMGVKDFMKKKGEENYPNSPVFGKQILKLTSAKLRNWDAPSEVRFAIGDVTGDGQDEIVIAYRAAMYDEDSFWSYYIDVIRVTYKEDPDDDWYSLERIAHYDTRFYWGRGLDVNNDEDNRYASRNLGSTFDVAVGDTDKDGKAEILFAGVGFLVPEHSNTVDVSRVHTLANVYGYRENILKELGAIDAIDEDSHRSGKYRLIRCAMADVDSSGFARPVVLARFPDGAYIYTCRYDSTAKNSFMKQKLSVGRNGNVRAIDLKVGNFSGEVKTGGSVANSDQIMCGLWNDSNIHAMYMYWNSWSSGSMFKEGNNWKATGVGEIEWDDSGDKDEFVRFSPGPLNLLVGDFFKRGVRLGAPVHIIREADQAIHVLMQEPPKHVDYTKISRTDYGVLNLTRTNGFFTEYSHSRVSAKETSSSQNAEGNTGVDVSAGSRSGVESKLEDIASTSMSVETSASLGVASGAKVNKLNESYSNTKSKISVKTTGDDYLSYSVKPVHIWRYPILGKKSLVSKDHQLWHTVTVPKPEVTRSYGGMQVKPFQPEWSNGNILSYPRTPEMIKDYSEKNKLGEAATFAVGRNQTSNKFSWSESLKKAGSLNLSVKFAVDTSLGFESKLSAMGVSTQGKQQVKVRADGLFSNTSTNKTSMGTDTEIGIEISGNFPDTYNNSMSYNVSPIIYKTDGGVVKTVYTVDIDQENMRWWEDRYADAPDPALNLPYMWVMDKGQWKIDEDAYSNPNARRIRGFFITKGDRNLDPGIEETGKISLRCRVHNFAVKRSTESDEGAAAAIKKSDNLRVKFEYAMIDNKGGFGPLKTIATPTTGYIPVWNNDAYDTNWRMIEAEWDITNVPDGRYRVFVTVNPDNNIAELPHHGRDTMWPWADDYCDNNRGWFDISILKPQSAGADFKGVRGFDSDDLKFFPEPDLELLFEEDSFDFELDDDEDTLTIRVNLLNEGTTPAMNVPVTLYCGDPDDGGVPIAVEILPGIFPEDGGVQIFFRLSKSEIEELWEELMAGEIGLRIAEMVGEKDAESNLFFNGKNNSDGSGSSGGCSAGAGAVVIALAAAVVVMRRRGQ